MLRRQFSMSLKAFHIVFIAASILLAFGFGGWCFREYHAEGRRVDLIFGTGSVVAGFGLLIYGRAILKKLKHISYL